MARTETPFTMDELPRQKNTWRNASVMPTPDITGGTDCEESPKIRAVGEGLQKLVHKAFDNAGPSGQAVKNFLNGTWLGEPLHLVLTDVPIGAWTTALVFDALEMATHRDAFGTAADALLPSV
jgi:hypothetical protein